MGAVCDVYDAITSNRPYKSGWDPLPALAAMREWAQDGQFDPAVVGAFARMMGPWPIGSLVRLRSQRLAVVNAPRAGRTSVTAFYCTASQRAFAPEVMLLANGEAADAIVGHESNAQWRFKDLHSPWAGDVVDVVRAAQATACLFT